MIHFAGKKINISCHYIKHEIQTQRPEMTQNTIFFSKNTQTYRSYK